MSVKQHIKFNVRDEMLKDSTDLLDNVEVTTIAQECVKLKQKEYNFKIIRHKNKKYAFFKRLFGGFKKN